jgi:hypothetical protein
LATDPLHDLLMKNRDWKAFLVEPVPSIFEKLKTTYMNRPNTFFKMWQFQTKVKLHHFTLSMISRQMKNKIFQIGLTNWVHLTGSILFRTWDMLVKNI